MSRFLINNGMKISKVASLSNDEISEKVLQLTSKAEGFESHINSFVLCSLQFDQVLFNKTYEQLREKYNLAFIYENVFIPTLRRIGFVVF